MSTVWQIKNNDRKRLKEDVCLLLDCSKALDWIGEKNSPVFLKPNLVTDKPASTGATTTPEIVEGLIIYLKDHGFSDVRISEGSWVGASTARAFQICGYGELSRKYGIPLINLQKDKNVPVKTDEGIFRICRTIYELQENGGSLINLPMLKGHGQTRITCALKNLKGCIPDSEKRRYHSLGVHRPVAMLNTIIKPAFALVDGLNGDPGWEEGGKPEEHNLLYLGKDPVSIDSYSAGLLGWKPSDIEYIGLSEAFGAGTFFSEGDLIELNPRTDVSEPDFSDREAVRCFLETVISQDSACSACYGHLASVLRGLLNDEKTAMVPSKIYIGQGYRGKEIKGQTVGIGRCTSGAQRFCRGCPPSRSEIMTFLTGLENKN